ncbi:HU family DNA-binding protein [Flavobacterium sp.]|uniref:HU family DNA-binding protein n=1 Tax=Flavobacterium sp. TaxID=239 RepID=UPI003F6A11E1
MSIKFKVLQRKNPQDLLAPEKYYAAAIGDGEIDLDALAEKIAYQCTLTEVDCHAVLLSLVHNVSQELNEGRIVRLGKLGTFQVGISAMGKDTPEEVSASTIVKSRILFRPGKKLRSVLTDLSYRKAG